MKHLLIVFALLGRLLAANQCAEHNILLSESGVKISMSGSARCTQGVAGGIQYNCPKGSAGMTAWGLDIQSPCYTSWVSYAIRTMDTNAGTHYDLGLYYINGPSASSLAGHVMVHTGLLTEASFAPHTGLTTIPWLEPRIAQSPAHSPLVSTH